MIGTRSKVERRWAVVVFTFSCSGVALRAQDERQSALVQLKSEAAALTPLLQTQLARSFVEMAVDLPHVEPRILYFDESTRTYYAARDRDGLSPEIRERLVEKTVDEERYYYTKYGTPLAYARAIDLAGMNGLTEMDGKRILDFGYGTIGHLRILAMLGADAVGVDVDSFLKALYSHRTDTGRVAGKGRTSGRVRLVTGQWPASDEVVAEVGRGFHLFISKNTLKNGYIHPEREVDPRRLVHLGVEDRAYVQTLFDVLNPGGMAIIYNLSPAPAPSDQPYIPWADGRCPFKRNLLESVGFEVIAFDADDSKTARAMGDALGWDEGEDGMNLETDLFGHYTIMRKPR